MKQIINNSSLVTLKAALKKKPAVKDLYARLKESVLNNQRQSLTRAYIGALSIIAVLTVIGHLLSAYMTSNQRENAEITFTMTNLRALSDVIVFQASSYKNSGDTIVSDLLLRSIDKLKTEYTRIEKQDNDTINGVFHVSPFFLNKRIKDFIDGAETYVSYRSANSPKEATVALDSLTNEFSRVLAINLDLALERYHADVMEKIEQSYRLQYISALTVLIVLFLEAAFIFRPLVQRLEKYYKDLIKLALTDMLTGLNNRRAFIQHAKAGLSYFHRHKRPFALVMMDLDKFKSVNDTHGHSAGDLVLQHFSKLMLQLLRKYDIIGRLGGEEFAIYLPQTTAEEALQTVERLRRRVMETPCPYTDQNGKSKMLSYTASFGIVAVASGDWTLDNLLIKADEGLYKAKEQGRNCVVMQELKEEAPAG